MLPTDSRPVSKVARVAGSVGLVALATFLCTQIPGVNPTTAGFVFLLTILVIAAEWGLIEAVVASLLATTCFNFFFLPPVYTFTIADPQNWVALFTFLVTSLVASQLSERARRRRDEAVSRRLEVEQLHALSHALLLMDSSTSLGSQIARALARVYELRSVTLYDRSAGQFHNGGPQDLARAEGDLMQAAVRGTLVRDEPAQLTVVPISLGGSPIGSLALAGRTFSEAALQSLSNLVAIGLERARGQEAASRAEAARRSEEFKSALLDAVAHEFKTPLTVIRAATSAVLFSSITGPAEQRELTSIVDKQAARLQVLVSEAIHLARIEAGKMRLSRQRCSIRTLIQDSLGQMETVLDGRPIEVTVGEDASEAYLDVELIQLVLRNLLDNAVKYSPPSAAIRIATENSVQGAVIRVWNAGPGIPEWERARIFEKFYRRASTAHVSGSGMGLAIARQILQAHGGDIHVESSPGRGVEFALTIPVEKEVAV